MNSAIKKSKTSVLIVGAGPSGLILALWLKKKNVDFRIIDKNIRPGETSRALAVQARTLEFYRQLGIAEEVIERGITVHELKMRRRGKIIARAPLGAMGEGMSRYPYLLFYSQDIHEAFLCEKLATLGTTIERQTELINFTQDEQRVVATIKNQHGEETIEADYLVGCDGAHSTVRHGLGLNFPGGTYSQIFYVADVLVSDMKDYEGLQVSVSKKDFCIIMPIKIKNSIRLTGIVPPENEKKEHITYEDVADSVTKNTGLDVARVNWFSVYHVHHRVVDHFQRGRVFLVGDAAHIHSPAGGQGMNTGIGDAINLAWKLAEVIQKRASPKLLESYEIERLAFARILVQTTDTAFSFIASRSLIGSLFRAYLLPAVFSFFTRIKPILRLMFITISQIRIKYRKSFLSQGISEKIHAGDRLPWVKHSRGDNFAALNSCDWQIHIYGEVRKKLLAYAKEHQLGIHVFDWNDDAREKGLMENVLYLIRPDGHIALINKQQDTGVLNTYLKSLNT